MLREKPLERLLVFRVDFPIHLKAKTHARTCTQSRVVNGFAGRQFIETFRPPQCLPRGGRRDDWSHPCRCAGFDHGTRHLETAGRPEASLSRTILIATIAKVTAPKKASVSAT